MLVQQERTKPRQSAGLDQESTDYLRSRSKGDGEDATSAVKIDFKTAYMRSQLLKKDPGRLGKKGTFTEYVSDNLSKIVVLSLVFLSVLILFYVRNRAHMSTLLCAQSASEGREAFHYPEVDFKQVDRVDDIGKFRVVKTDKWIVVAASGPPTEQIQSLVKMQGWQVVAVGDSETPSNWDVRGAVFLSVEQQAMLGFRILAHLPYVSYVRKSVGYLFAIQHGAKVIYDADQDASILGGDLSKLFELEVLGWKNSSDTLLQYSSLHNRTTVNPYIHFGHRSVWPRGLPLESVSSINAEIYYGHVSSGNQYIQQGVANGFPDVDSVFYHTRKSELESFNIKFDSHALPVALPQGTMAPVNHLNTLFHSQAFWALMLPISVNPQVSDIVRGYWAQRLLWEIGGYLAVYPPSIYRIDSLKPHSFEDEKDLHDNVDALIEFLVAWTSKKPTFFKRVVDLSFAMAQEGFWAAQDVDYTVAWLQDLVSVGYTQPTLFALEVDRGRPLTDNPEHWEFVPLALPSVHLGVDEASTVGFEVGNLLRWRKYYGGIVLIMWCGWPVNETVLGWRMLYGRLFKTIVVLSEKSDASFGVEAAEEWQTYRVLPEIFERYSDAEGFLFLRDHVILNYWNLLQANKTKLWSLNKVRKAWKVVGYNKNGTEWYLKSSVKRTVRKMASSLSVDLKITYTQNMGEGQFAVSKSDVFYVPRRLAAQFGELAAGGVSAKLHHELAIPLFLLALDPADDFDADALSTAVYKTGSDAAYAPHVHLVRPLKANTQRQLLHIIQAMAAGDPLLLEVL